MTVRNVADVEKKERHQKQTIVALFSVCIIGFSYLFYDYFQITNRVTLPEDFSQINRTVDGLRSNGLVDRLDVRGNKLVVDEQKWSGISKAEKVGIVTQLARYCADGQKSDNWLLVVEGNRSHSVVGELGSRGLVIP
jgi:hypothetical protein